MGSIFVPAYAIIFMANFELKYIYPYIKDKTKMFLRFIDDLFMIWTGSEQELLNFMSDLNKRHPSIKFKFKYSQTKIDVLVYKDKLHINPNLAEIFQNPPIFNFRGNKNHRDIVDTKLIENRKVKRKCTNKIQGKCTPYLANNRALCYK